MIPVIVKYKPDLILVSLGFDGLALDPTDTMNLTPECYGEIINTLIVLNVPMYSIGRWLQH